jgi:hypothetical protein
MGAYRQAFEIARRENSAELVKYPCAQLKLLDNFGTGRFTKI